MTVYPHNYGAFYHSAEDEFAHSGEMIARGGTVILTASDSNDSKTTAQIPKQWPAMTASDSVE